MDPFTDPDFSYLAEYLVVSFSALLFALGVIFGSRGR